MVKREVGEVARHGLAAEGDRHAGLGHQRQVVRAVAATNPDIFFAASYPPDSVGLIRASSEVGFKPKIYGGGMVGLQATAIKTQLGPLLNGVVVYDFWLPWAGFATDEGRALIKKYQAKAAGAGVDMFHASTRRFWEPEFPDHDSRLNLAGWAKKITGLPTMTVGSVGLDADFHTAFRDKGAAATEAHLEGLCAMLERGDVDMVAIGRALLANPDWPNKVRAHRFAEVAPYDPAVLETLV